MAYIISPNMNLIIPSAGNEPGPTFAMDMNSSLTLVDQHDHTPGKGVALTAASLNINADLSMNGHFLTDVAGVTLTEQGSTPANGTVYQSSAGYLYYVDLISGTNIQITNSSGIVGTAGSIAGLVAPATATYVPMSTTFVWQSDVNKAANMDAASVIIRNPGVTSSNGVTLKATTLLGSSYSITLPQPVGGGGIMYMSSSGVQAAQIVLDETTLTHTTSGGSPLTLLVKNLGIDTAQLKDGAVTGAKIAALTVANGNIVNTTIDGTKFVSNVNLPGKAVQEAGLNVIVSNTNASTNSLAVVRANISKTGTIVIGEGISSVVANGSGSATFTITWTTAFLEAPVVTATINFGLGSDADPNPLCSCIVVSTSTTECIVQTWGNSPSPVLEAHGFGIIAMGQRA